MDTETANTSNDRSRLLVVDDIQMNRNLMTQQLLRNGYAVETADCGPAALQLIEQQHFDLILLDIRMPEMDGLEVLRRIRENYTSLALPVIMVTAEDLEESIIEALQIGANDYLVKPLNLSVALARIQAQLTVKHLASLKDEVVRFASHDLKKPLMVMLDIAESLNQELHPGEAVPNDANELLDLLIRTGQNMQQVVSGFLDQRELRQEEKEIKQTPLDVNEIVQRSFNTNTNYAERKGINLQQHLADNLPHVSGNEFRLLQVLDNLIGNALKFCPQGAQVEVSTGLDDQGVVIDVKDSGPGLTEDDFSQLFVKNAKLSNKPTGTETSSGVGLAMCKQLITIDNGQIGARNNPGQGVTFWVKLPIAS